jgi:putative aldouronate transport system permease protein
MYTVVSNRDVTNLDQATAYAEVNSATLQSAQLFVSLIPILIIYPFLQKHFTKGLTIGAVKG